MSVTIEIDEKVLREAERVTNIHDPAELVRSLLEEKIARRAAQSRLDALGGTMTDLELPARQRRKLLAAKRGTCLWGARCRSLCNKPLRPGAWLRKLASPVPPDTMTPPMASPSGP